MRNPHPPKVALLAPGMMGAAIAARLQQRGLEVVTCLEGRSSGSRARAATLGLPDVPRAALAQSDILLSVVPPAAAEQLANELVAAGVFAHGGPLFADCNALAPDTMQRVAAIISDAGGRCVDAAIVGAPPDKDGKVTPVLYASGEHAAALATLGRFGLNVHVLDAPIGAASALKMCFAAVSKGLTALVTQVALQAHTAAVADPLHAQLASSLGPTLQWAARQAPMLAEKSYRWVDEMHEIAHFLRDIPGAEMMFRGAAEYYAWLDSNKVNPEGPLATLQDFFAPNSPRLGQS